MQVLDTRDDVKSPRAARSPAQRSGRTAAHGRATALSAGAGPAYRSARHWSARWIKRVRRVRGLHGARINPLAPRTLVLLAALVAITGVALTLGTLGAGQERAASKSSGALPTLAQDVKTSFGTVNVETVTAAQGLTSQQLSGQTHGIQGLVGADQMQIEVSVVLTNSLNTPVPYTPDLFALITDTNSAAIAPSFSDFETDTLQPHTHIEGTVSFIVPIGTKTLLLRFDDPGTLRPMMFDLGKFKINVTR